METTKREYLEQKHAELFNNLGCFWAFSNEQFKEGLQKAGGIEKTGKYVSLGAGLCCPKKNIDDLIKGMGQIKKDWIKERKKTNQIKLIFQGIDDWNRPVWKAPDEKAFFGSVTELFNWGTPEEEVLKKVDIYGLCYFGEYFGCEPTGTSVPDKYFI